MGNKIKILSESTINQIAAGEVIENPASVVKELVENAIDAGARQIVIELMGGGFHLIRVSDDGSGMSPEDAFISLERHATSKISQAEELFSLSTMGFRGEALASIAAVSKFSLLTCDESGSATHVACDGGKGICKEEGARKRGATVAVRSLFYNVPARKKFQKSPAASAAEVTKVVSQLSLAHPEVGFELVQQERVVFSLPPQEVGELSERLSVRSKEVLGDLFHSSALKLFSKEEQFCLEGVIGGPGLARQNRTGQYLFINRRPVNSLLVAYAVKEGYGTRIDKEGHPVFVLHLTVPGQLVDVNVHPQKREVRFRQDLLLKEKIKTAVSLSLQRAETMPSVQSISFEPQLVPPFDFSAPAWQFSGGAGLKFKEEGQPSHCISEELPITNALCLIGLFTNYLLLDARSVSGLVALPENTAPGILMVDLLAAAERVTFERLVKNDAGPAATQGLLLPETVAVSSHEMQLLEANRSVIEKVGIALRPFGTKAIIVDAVPSFMEASDIALAIFQILACLQEGNWVDPLEEKLQRRLAAVVVRFVRARKKSFVLQETIELFRQLMSTSAPYQCPQGKPTLHHLTAYEIEQFFKK